MPYADIQTQKHQERAWKNGKWLSRKTGVLAEDYQLALFASPIEVIFPSPLLSSPPGSALRKTQGPKVEGDDCGKQKMGTEGTPCWVGYHVTDGPRPAQLGFPSLPPRKLSTPKATKNLLTQLAMEHSPKTFPISATSQEPWRATKWRQ